MSAKTISIKPVMQEEGLGCGIACAAMLASTSYAEAAKIILAKTNDKKSEAKRTGIGELEGFLSVLNVPWERKSYKPWQDIKGLAIIGVDENEKREWHWVLVVRDSMRSVLIDPSNDFPVILYNTENWIDVTGGYIQRKNCPYISVPLKVSSIVV